MKKEEAMSKNINLAFDFLDYLIENPSEIEKIPSGSSIKFVNSTQKKKNHTSTSSEKILKVRKVYEFV
jgi:hypothetical protein